MNTGCEFFADALVERATGSLDASQAERVDDHLTGCAGCRATLETITALRAAPAPVPGGLEARVRGAVREALAQRARPAVVAGGARWRPWALPLAAAAALVALWIGVGLPDRSTGTDFDAAVAAFQEYTPYGNWPGAEGSVAGAVVLSDLSIDELEALLREMES